MGGVQPALAEAQTVAPTRDELTRPQPPRPESRSNLSVAGDVERSPCPLGDPQFADVKVTVRDVVFNNLKGATADEMRFTWADLAGRELPVSAICDIRDRAGTLLRDKGYLAAVQVPAQRIENGVVRLEVLYGRVTAIRARGQTEGAERKLTGYLEQLTHDEIFDRYRAERYLLLARDLPGYNVQLTLRPAGTGPGELIGEVTVVRRPYAVDFTLQNLAAAETGRWGGQLRAQAFGLTGLGDATSLSFYSTADFREQQILQIEHQFRPGSQGLTINGQLTYAWTKPDLGTSSGPELKAKTLFATLGVTYPLLRSQAKNWSVGGGLDFVDQRVELIAPLTRDKLRVAWARTDFDLIDLDRALPRYRFGGSLELRKGLDIFGATNRCGLGCTLGTVVPPSRVDGDPTATLIRAAGAAEVSLGKSLALFVSPRVQHAFNPLLSFEEFTGGNYTIGRGYDPGVILGDSGAGIVTELRGPRLQLFASSPLRVQPFAFGDAAWVWNKHTSGDPDRLVSAGGGVRGELGDRLRLDATVAVPLRKAGLLNLRPDPRFLISLTTRLLPWR